MNQTATVNFLYKVKMITKKNGEVKTKVSVFDSLQCRTVKKIFWYKADELEVMHWLQTSEEFKYKNYQVYFINNAKVNF